MDTDILTLAGTVSGADETEQGLLIALCSVARQRWERRLLPGLSPGDCGAAFPCAVAFSAAADLQEGRSDGCVSGFTAGEISVRTASSAQRNDRAEALRKTAERLMAPFAETEDLIFRGVRG